MLIYEDEFIKVYNDNAYITVHYLDKSQYKITGDTTKSKHGDKYVSTHYIRQEAWRVFTWDSPRSNFEYAIKKVALQRMKSKNKEP